MAQWINDKGDEVNFVEDAATETVDVPVVTIEGICALCWQSHIAWENIIGEGPRVEWNGLSDDAKQRVRDSVKWFLDHPTATLSAEHDAWRARHVMSGVATHPNYLPFDAIPLEQQMKLRIWRHMILAVIG